MPAPPPRPMYSHRLDAAVALATDSFRFEVRKATDIPYLCHLLQVMVWVGEYGGDEDQMIAAVLHDYLEDVEGSSEAALEAQFGSRVARFVADLSDTQERPKPPWKARKVAYIGLLRHKEPELKLISACDKLHNADSIVRDLDSVGDALWDRFTAPKSGTLWYYASVTEALGHGWTHPVLDRLERTVEDMHVRGGVRPPPTTPRASG
ncbi:MAG: bifunctional (p)ppGpp synthetase/guanosine-3',5'-bis(diphosphate) 3'-pyrophosphohydrolase [Proteobacteria bacterium]|nr:bifunctional (p)ppGpp synthetase/guanosine-3',5'-bis(diphosphate) 3'-pyrophosphohydrolase [Pseudomonadota bacterium]MCP4915311.1 bifunctional (p)ppGpp synthetase/guanosine-3',5'-bis(diphosphate) 3'-pyrophosphohydrolase [Pseudomonadota bacterium]